MLGHVLLEISGIASFQLYLLSQRFSYLCISRESNPGHMDGNDVFYHYTTDALMISYECYVSTPETESRSLGNKTRHWDSNPGSWIKERLF